MKKIKTKSYKKALLELVDNKSRADQVDSSPDGGRFDTIIGGKYPVVVEYQYFAGVSGPARIEIDVFSKDGRKVRRSAWAPYNDELQMQAWEHMADQSVGENDSPIGTSPDDYLEHMGEPL